jgi:nitrogen fixation protein NifB
MHLPVSPNCNIQCRFCHRQFDDRQNRPGVSRRLLRPEECLDKVIRGRELCPEITVVGIAGPGDPLASDHALTAFRQIHGRFPELIKCMSTNGLMLARRAEEVVEAGVQTVTVTVNGVDPGIVQAICTSVHWEGQFYTGRAAAEILLAQQMLGIRSMRARGVLVKINSVLIPGVNAHHMGAIARSVAQVGATLINIIPLIPQHALAHCPAPSCEQLAGARAEAERYLPVFRHCRQCRADACGILGGDQELSRLLYEEPQAATFSHG